MSSPASLVFLVGMLRSGTTVFAQMLDQHPDIFAAGELSNFWRSIRDGGACQCGQLVSRCELWAQVYEVMTKETGHSCGSAETLRRSVARDRHVGRVRRHATTDNLSPAELEYRAIRTCLLETVRRLTGAAAIVDTSKKAVELAYVASESAVAVHLLRNPFQVAASESDRTRFQDLSDVERPPVRSPLASAALWTLTNAQASRVTRDLTANSRTLRLEEVLRSPTTSLDAVIRAARLGSHAWRATSESFYFPPGHIVCGNPTRRKIGWQPLASGPGRSSGLTALQVLAVRAATAPYGRHGYGARPPGVQ